MAKEITRVFGRIPRFDKKSRRYPIMALIEPGAKLRSYTWQCSVFLNQGSEGACTGFAVAGEAAARPVVVPNITNKIARAIYKRAQQLDEWPGENYEGSSVLGAIKAGTEKGWYLEYRWAFGEDDLAMAIGHKGPAVLGVNWYAGMMKTDEKGFIRPFGKLMGGHAILCHSFNERRGEYKLHNSWGQSWGTNGECKITREDMAYLLKKRGEACIPIVRRKG